MRCVILLVILLLAAIGLMTIISPSGARDNGQWGSIDPVISNWIQKLMQPDNPRMSCCGEADAYWADSYEMSKDGEYVAIITDDRDIPSRYPRKVGTKIVIPNYKIKWDQGNPTGHGWIFIGVPNQIYCYVPPGGV